MFSTSAPFFNPGNSEEGSGSNSSNSGSPANPDGSNSSNSGSPANPDGSAPISAKAESIKAVYYEKKAERSRVGEEYKKVNDRDILNISFPFIVYLKLIRSILGIILYVVYSGGY